MYKEELTRPISTSPIWKLETGGDVTIHHIEPQKQIQHQRIYVRISVKYKKIKRDKSAIFRLVPRGDPAEARTQDPQIKSLLLYQLSYEVDVSQMY